MQDKGHDHYPQEWADTTETTDSGLEEAQNQGKEMLAAQVEFDAALRERLWEIARRVSYADFCFLFPRASSSILTAQRATSMPSKRPCLRGRPTTWHFARPTSLDPPSTWLLGGGTARYAGLLLKADGTYTPWISAGTRHCTKRFVTKALEPHARRDVNFPRIWGYFVRSFRRGASPEAAVGVSRPQENS